MSVPAMVLVGLICFVHIYIAVFEMFFWEKRGPKVFSSFERDLFPKTKALAFNQGVYNGFLAAGLLWSFFISDPVWQRNVATCFVAMVGVAGIAGAATAEKKILFVQTIPAALALAALWLD